MGVSDAEHAEDRPGAANLLLVPVSCPVPDRREGAPRLSGRLAVRLTPGSRAASIYCRAAIAEEYFCNYELNPAHRDAIDAAGLRVVGWGDSDEARIVELPGHPFYIATLFQPQRASRPEAPHPVITEFVRVAERERAPVSRSAP